jgi:anti-sigma regulatory factor (Ser/Thr protein kinase)
MTLRAECQGRLEDIPALSAAVEAFCLDHGVEARTAHKLVLGLEELLTNLAVHGAAAGPLGSPPAESVHTVMVVVSLEDSKLVARYQDSGAAFDPLSVPAPDLDQPVEARPVGGLGLHLLRTLMDEVRYARVNERNHVTLVLGL